MPGSAAAYTCPMGVGRLQVADGLLLIEQRSFRTLGHGMTIGQKKQLIAGQLLGTVVTGCSLTETNAAVNHSLVVGFRDRQTVTAGKPRSTHGTAVTRTANSDRPIAGMVSL